MKNALIKNTEANKELASLRGTTADFYRLLDAATANNNSATGASASTRLKQLSDAHQQCEKGYRIERDRHAETLGVLGEAVTTINALKR